MINKEKYRQFCDVEEGILLFSQAWWLDSVCGDAWDVCLVEKNNKIIACMPYYTKSRYGFTQLLQPPLTQNLGPWLKPSKAKYSKMLGQQKDLMQALIALLPKYHYFNQNWHFSQKNWLPFYWQGFKQTTRYTYVIDDLSDLDEVWSGTQANIKTDIKKAQNKFNLTVHSDLSIETFIALNKLTFSRQGKSLPYSEMLVKEIAFKAKKRNQCKIFIAQDGDERNHAGVFIIWDKNSAYYIMGGGCPELRNSGATSLCMWEAIKFASTVTQKFDFEGSMIESVERFFRNFGAEQKTYFNVSKSNSKVFKLIQCARQVLSQG